MTAFVKQTREQATRVIVIVDKDTGIGSWTEDQIVTYLGTGNRPDGDVAGGLMGESIQGTLAGYKDMTKADLQAIAKYLKAIPAVKNKIE